LRKKKNKILPAILGPHNIEKYFNKFGEIKARYVLQTGEQTGCIIVHDPLSREFDDECCKREERLHL
jgi:hypothetical protein